MDWPVYFPNVKKGSTKDLIIRLLTQERSLSNQKIFNGIKKQFGVSITYQSVRQALVELKEEGVLTKEGKDYSISTEWIMTLHEYVELLKKKYVDHREVRIIDENTKEIQLQSYYDLGHFILYSLRDEFFDMKGEQDLYAMLRNAWFPFFNKRKRDLARSIFSKKKNYFFIANKGIINRVFAYFYREFGPVKLGVKFDEFFDIIIQGDCVVKIHMTNKLNKELDELYATKNPFSMKVMDRFSEISFNPSPVKILITRDKELADEMKRKIRSL